MRAAVSALVVLLLSAPASGQDRSKGLDAGQIYVDLLEVKGSDAPKAVVEAVIEAPPAQVFWLFEDCRRYPGRISRIKSAKVVKTYDGHQVCEVVLSTPVPLPNLTAITDAEIVRGPPTWSRTWKNLGADYKQNDGRWVLKVWNGDPNRTHLLYEVIAEPDLMVPSFIQTYAQKTSLPDLIERLRREVRKLPVPKPPSGPQR